MLARVKNFRNKILYRYVIYWFESWVQKLCFLVQWFEPVTKKKSVSQFTVSNQRFKNVVYCFSVSLQSTKWGVSWFTVSEQRIKKLFLVSRFSANSLTVCRKLKKYQTVVKSVRPSPFRYVVLLILLEIWSKVSLTVKLHISCPSQLFISKVADRYVVYPQKTQVVWSTTFLML